VVVTRAIFRRRFTSLPSARSRPAGGVIPISLIEVILQLGACLLEKRDSPHWCAIVFRDYEQGVENIADLARSIDGAVTHPIPSRPFRLAGMLSQPHGARKGPPKGKVRRAQTPPGAASPRRRPIAPKAHRPAAGDTCQEAEAVKTTKRAPPSMGGGETAGPLGLAELERWRTQHYLRAHRAWRYADTGT
jgi:hypothetical protein